MMSNYDFHIVGKVHAIMERFRKTFTFSEKPFKKNCLLPLERNFEILVIHSMKVDCNFNILIFPHFAQSHGVEAFLLYRKLHSYGKIGSVSRSNFFLLIFYNPITLLYILQQINYLHRRFLYSFCKKTASPETLTSNNFSANEAEVIIHSK